MFNKDTAYGGAVVALVALLTLSVLTQGFGFIPCEADNTTGNTTAPPDNNSTYSGEKPVVQLYTMSYCPYGNVAEEGIEPAIELLDDYIVFEPHFVIYSQYAGGGSDYCIENGAYCSMHGIQELNQDMRELCVWKYDKEKYWDFVFTMNDKCNYQNADTCWESIASGLGIDTAKVKTCQASESATLAAAEYALNTKYGVSGSPALVIDGKKVSPTSRTPEAYKQVICDAFDTPPSECSTVLSSAGTAVTGGCG